MFTYLSLAIEIIIFFIFFFNYKREICQQYDNNSAIVYDWTKEFFHVLLKIFSPLLLSFVAFL
jgi:hypothetical protein